MEAEEKLLTILKQVMEEKLTSTNVEVRTCTWQCSAASHERVAGKGLACYYCYI